MNELNDIILSIKKGEEEKSFDNKERQSTYLFEKELNDWVLHLKEKLSKRNYKRVIKDIVSFGLITKFKKSPHRYKLITLYIQAKLKVIENKIFKYHFNQNDRIKQKHQINHCFSYANKIQDELNLLLQEISVNNNIYDNCYYNEIDKRNYKIELFDNIIRCLFDYIYTMSLFHYKIGNFMDTISYLSLFLSLYKETRLFILSTHTLYKISKCFILLSQIYISNEDYENALIFLNESIKVSFKQILFQVHELYYGVFVGEKSDLIIREKDDLLILKDSRIKRVILNIIIIFFYQGICNENLSIIKKATAFYKQCEWFSRKFISKYNQIIYKLFYKLKQKGIEVCNIIDFFKDKIEEYEIKQWQKKKEDNSKDIKKKNYLIKKNKLYDNKKFNGLIEKLQGLNIKEIDTINIFDKNKNIKCLNSYKIEGNDKNIFLSNIRLLNAYLGKDFKNIVNNMEKINLFDLNYRTRSIIQKTLNKIYFEQNQKVIKDKNKSLFYKQYRKYIKLKSDKRNDKKEIKKQNKDKNNINKSISKFKIIKYNSLNIEQQKKGNNNRKINKSLNFLKQENSDFSRDKKRHYSASSSFVLNSYRERNNNKISRNKSIELIYENKKGIYKNKNKSLAKIHKSSKYKLIPPENQKLNNFFNFKYLKKIDYIKKLSDRELLFQKSILKSKNTPRLSFQLFNQSISKINANNSFKRIESLVMNRIGLGDWKENLSEEEYKEYLLNKRLEKTLLCSLDNKALFNYKLNKIKRKRKEEEKEFLEDTSKYDKSFGNINNNNKNTLDELNLKLNLIYENEIKRKKEIIENKRKINREINFFRNHSKLNRLDIKDSSHSFSYLMKKNINKSHS